MSSRHFDSYEEELAELLHLTVPQLRLLRTVSREAVVRPGPAVLRVMDALTLPRVVADVHLERRGPDGAVRTRVIPMGRPWPAGDEATYKPYVFGRSWGRYLISEFGRRSLARATPQQPVYFSAGGSLPFTSRPTPAGKKRGRHVVDDGVPDRERGYSTARQYEDREASLEAVGLTVDPSRRRQGTDPGERVDPDTLLPKWKKDAVDRHVAVLGPEDRARRLATLAARR